LFCVQGLRRGSRGFTPELAAALRPGDGLRRGDFTAEAGFESGPPRTPETSPEPTPTKDPSPKPAVKASGSSDSSSESDVDDGKQDQDREEEAENREEEEDDWYSHLLPDPDRQRVTIHPYRCRRLNVHTSPRVKVHTPRRPLQLPQLLLP
jgi:hypothetical protein